ncbi:hypothetical protein [Paraliobacillus sediminis]|uniref:hypothetical protein n=1 Tax=Paraliobacillus sediminis TaxID=1885916 RepID=UPI0013C2FD55|nr:hypothetical protein [Paraliobacillus sediminis]
MRKRYKQIDEEYQDHYASKVNEKETVTNEDIMKYTNKNNTMPVNLTRRGH